jgi:hypothetical protein
VQAFGNKWTQIAEFVGGGVNAKQCAQHWNTVMNPELSSQKDVKGPWSDDEVRNLDDNNNITLYIIHHI